MVFFKDEPGAHLDPAAGADSDHFNGESTSAAALHQPAGPKKRRHRISRQEKDKDQHVGGESEVCPFYISVVQVCVYLVARRFVLNKNRSSNSSCCHV